MQQVFCSLAHILYNIYILDYINKNSLDLIIAQNMSRKGCNSKIDLFE